MSNTYHITSNLVQAANRRLWVWFGYFYFYFSRHKTVSSLAAAGGNR